MNKQPMQLKMLALVASILLSGCGARRVKESHAQIPNTPIFQNEDPKKFAIPSKGASDRALETTVQTRYQDLSPEYVQSKLLDIPLPFATTMIFAHPAQAHGVCVGFEAAGTQKDIAAFYEREMELLGWNKRSAYVSSEVGYVFEKPNKICIIVLRDTIDKRGKITGSRITVFA